MKTRTLAQLGEDGLIARLTAAWKIRRPGEVGVGDDCAVLKVGREQLVFKTDAMVEGRHFLPDTKPEWIGRKALARVLSDFAAMGAVPRAAVITLGLPKDEAVVRLDGIYRGLEKMARASGLDLVGGETVRSEELWISVSGLGEMKGVRPVLRTGARAGHDLWVTGTLGGSYPRKQFLFEPRLAEGRWLAQQRIASAMMDVSDGLAADLPRLARASGVGFSLEREALPLTRGARVAQALRDGEDFELLFTAPRKHRSVLETAWPFPCRMTRIGGMIRDSLSSTGLLNENGFDHFKLR
jgi:thiamine-monophosphate kinase